jgi:signal transduction histidine kinase
VNAIINNLASYLVIFLACLLAAWAIYNRDKKKIEEQTRDLQLLFNIARAIGSSLDLKLLIANTVKLLLPLVGGDRFALLTANDKGVYSASVNQGLASIEGLDDLIAKASANDEIVNAKNIVALPLAAKGKTVGILLLGGSREIRFSGRREKNLLSAAADQLAIAVENAAVYEKEKQAVARLTELDHLKNEFISMVSHELRTPVAAADGYVSLFLAGVTGPVSDEQKKYLTIIKDNDQRLLSLIDRLLDFSSMETGSFKIKKELISINEIVSEVEKSVAPRLAGKQARLRLELNAQKVNFMGDRDKMCAVLVDLIDNALKFSSAAAPEIRIVTANKGGLIEVSVADNGIGLAKEHLGAIFNEFYQVEATMTRKTGGVGLGLAIVKEIIAQHHGKIWAESAGKGKGTKIIIDLPSAEKVKR